jgi:hypothetical protein
VTPVPVPRYADMEFWRIVTPFAVGGVYVRDGVIIGGAPIFRKWKGKPLLTLLVKWKGQRIS